MIAITFDAPGLRGPGAGALADGAADAEAAAEAGASASSRALRRPAPSSSHSLRLMVLIGYAPFGSFFDRSATYTRLPVPSVRSVTTTRTFCRRPSGTSVGFITT